MKKFAHFGAVCREKQEGMNYIESIKCWASDPSADPNTIEFLFFEPDSPMADTLVAKGGHIAYAVDDVEAMTAGKECIFGPAEVAPGVKIAFFVDEFGVVTEYAQMG
ncbi:MAG: hypothetical protein Q4C96_09890 [Planctomycetia bacterium]|nr:hypothetical protein [Planctomycetia bacterium]